MTPSMRVLLIDDERLARAELRRLLAAHPHVEIVGEAANAAEGVQQIAALQPDLVLLDVQMPGGSGFDMLAALDHAPQVIFTTAFDRYALQAFEVNALDYLQKPIQPTRMAAALQRCAARQPAIAAPGASATPVTTPPKLFIKDGERCWFVALADIVLFSSEGNYARVHFGSQQPLMPRSLNQLEERLDPAQFLRANRRQIVNLAHVTEVSAKAADGLELLLADGTRVEVSRRRAQQFRAIATL